MRRVLTILAAALAAFLLTDAPIAAVQGQAYCGVRDTILTQLYLKYQEQPVAIGLTSAGSLIEVLVSEAGTWTVIKTSPGGITCVVESGMHWQPIERQVPGRRS